MQAILEINGTKFQLPDYVDDSRLHQLRSELGSLVRGERTHDHQSVDVQGEAGETTQLLVVGSRVATLRLWMTKAAVF